ncbi:MAG: hypothetical protein ACXVJO_17225, partial [Thermoanaerobaculia bacterium]
VLASPLDDRLNNEMARLDAVLKAIDTPSLAQDARPMLEGNRTLLNRVRSTADPSLRLYRLRDAAIGIDTLHYILDHKSDESDMKRVQALADAIRPSIDKPLAPMTAPALQLALRQVAANRAQKLLRASIPYGKASGPANGLFYIGEAEGNRRYRDFVESVPLGHTSEPRPNAAAIAAALTRLDSAALAAYDKDPTSRSAVVLSATLKEARELADRGMLEGAALLMTEAERTAAVPVASATHADSITTALQASDTTGKDVVALYASLFANTTAERKVPKNVTVTLVRWPYT